MFLGVSFNFKLSSTFIQKRLWHLLIYMYKIEEIEREINIVMGKWLLVPSGLSDTSLYCRKAKLVLPFKSVMKEKPDTMMLHESPDQTVLAFQPLLRMVRKWKANSARVHLAITKFKGSDGIHPA